MEGVIVYLNDCSSFAESAYVDKAVIQKCEKITLGQEEMNNP